MIGVKRLAISVSDFFLCLILALFSIPSLQWLLGGAQQTLTHQARQYEIDHLKKNLRENQRMRENRGEEYQGKLRRAEQLEGQLQAATASGPNLQEAVSRREQLQRQLAERHTELSALLRQLRFLQAQQDVLRWDREQAAKERREAEEVARRLALQKEEVKKLQNQVNEATAKAERAKIGPPVIRIHTTPVAVVDKREAVFVALVDGTVRPLREPYYVVEKTPIADFYTPDRPGETFDKAMVKGSDFQKLLDGVNPRTQFVALLVDSSSFETFRSVRELLRERRISFGWEPLKSHKIAVSHAGMGIQIRRSG